MSILACLFLAVGLADLVRAEGGHTRWVRRAVGCAAGLALLVLLGVLGHLRGGLDIALLVTSALALGGWVVLSGRAFDARLSGRLRPGLALGVLAAIAALLLGASGHTSPIAGPLGDWLTGLAIPGLHHGDATAALLVLGALLIQLSTANHVVRLVLAGVGAIKPTGQPQASDRLRGGRLLGPMERLLIVGLGLAGEVTAAGLVIAAKGLIRWPELQAQSRDPHTPGIDEVTEYFLVGSFVSWLIALGALWVCAN